MVLCSARSALIEVYISRECSSSPTLNIISLNSLHLSLARHPLPIQLSSSMSVSRALFATSIALLAVAGAKADDTLTVNTPVGLYPYLYLYSRRLELRPD